MVDKNLIALSVCVLSDSLSIMVVMPSLIFYVFQNGGTKDDYGIIYSSFMFAMFFSSPVLGAYSDKNGFRRAFLVTQAISVFGGFCYMIAPEFSSYGRMAVYTILLGRLIGGIGAGNATLTLAYVARAYTEVEQEKNINLIQTIELVGTMFGPAPNYLLQFVDFSIGGFHVDKLNAVGLLMVVLNICAMVAIYKFLDELSPEDGQEESAVKSVEGETTPKDEAAKTGEAAENSEEASLLEVGKAVISYKDILFYLGLGFIVSAAFQTMDIVATPASNHALGWEPADVSLAFAAFAAIMTLNGIFIFSLLDNGVTYQSMLKCGMLCGTIGFTLLYFMWTEAMNKYEFLFPFLFLSFGVAYMQTPIVALFTEAVNNKNDLVAHQGKMQALNMMVLSLSQFTAPAFAASFMVRTPEEVDASSDGREMTPVGLTGAVAFLIGFLSLFFVLSPRDDTRSDKEETDLLLESEVSKDDVPNESTSLMSSSNGKANMTTPIV